MKKNCHNCKHGETDTDFQEPSGPLIEYFVCTKRDANNDIEFENNLERPEYLEKAKRCCEL